MEWYEIKVDGRKSVKFPEKVLPSHNTTEKRSSYANKLGGIIKKGEWAWLAKDASLQIVSLKYGHTVSTFEFAESKGYENCVIKCADQVFPNETNGVYLAVCLESMNSSCSSFAAIYSVDHSTVLSCMDIKLRVNCCRFLESTVCRRSLLQNFNGCLAVGSMEGVIVLLDLNMAKVLAIHEKQIQDDVFIPCHVIDYNMPLREIHRNFKQCQQDGVHFGLQMEVMDAPCSVNCLLPIDLTLSLAVGLEDGRLVLYDLTELQIFYVATPEQHDVQAPLVKIDFLEPPDDPRPCLYIWALHEGDKSLTAVLHSLMYEKRVTDHNVDNFCFLEIFQTSCIRLLLSLESRKSTALSCQSITRSTVHAEDDTNCLCAFTWYAENEHKNKVLVFDLNQWYKEEMPYSVDANRNPNYLAAYVLNVQQCALQSYINPATIAHFNSLQRFEEHFHPSSLSFDCALLMRDSCLSYNWEGAQNRFINILRSSNASIFLEPNSYFNEIIRTRLMPQFCELNANSTFSKNAKYEVILSVALEHSCFSLLRDCAKCWVDGSFMGNISATTGITLSTLTDWAWKRATDIKTRCNDLCKGLFDFGGYPLDQREQKELGFISRQLKLLADLQDEVLTFSKQNVPEKVHNNFELKYKSIRMASDYQDILLWLLNIGLLPEASPYSSKVNPNHELVPYPYKLLKELYTNKRVFFGKISDNLVSKKTGSCRLLYIDALIEHECKGNVLREYWQENNGDGLYPPTSIEAMLRVMLVPDMSYDSKCAVMLYFFLDLNMTINDEAYKSVVANFIKFPSVFKLSASLIKTVQAFWNLDHCHFLPAVDEFISPFNKNQNYPQWLLELLIETLLTQNAANLALRILEARSSLISPILKLQTLLANELISEAFHFARSKQDDALLEQFFKCCLCNGKFGVIRDLALSEKEGKLVQEILKNSKTENAENLHFVYLLQKSKYIEAVSYMDEISKSKCMRSNLNSSTTMNTPNLVMAAYNTTMTPVTQGLTDVYFRIKNKIRKKETDNKSPVPLSCQLIKQKANKLLGGIYHSSALSAHFATYYWGEMDNMKKNAEETNSLLSSNNAPFLRKAQIESNFLDFGEKNTISYPRIYKVIEKRTLAESEMQETGAYEKTNAQENPKKRRKVIHNDIQQDLSNVLQMTKNTPLLNNTDFLTQPSHLETETLEKEEMESFLTQPPSLKPRTQANEVVANNTIKSLASSEIHGILKTNTPEPMERHSVRRDMPVEEEAKNIRFNLPSSESEQEDGSISDHTQEPRLPTEVQLVVPLYNESKKTITRSVSVESSISISSTDSSRAPSEENFYSPISSQNNSLVVESSLNETKNTALTTPNRLSIAEGPKARKPLARLSVESLESENSEKSESPEPKGLETVVTKDRSPSLKPEVPKVVAKPIQSNVQYPQGIKFLNLDTRNSGILYENVSPPIVISSVESIVSNIQEFIPQVSSSKVSETQSKFSTEGTETQIKISEHSTVVGSLTFIESNVESCKEYAHAEENPKKMATEELDTTLGMSSYDLTLLDSTTVQKTRSYFQQNIAITAKEAADASSTKNNKEVLSTDGNIYADLETDAEMESDHESEMLFDVIVGLQDNLDANSGLEKETSTALESNENIDKIAEDVIVLSSSEDEKDEVNTSFRNNEDSDLSRSVSSYDNEEEEEEEAEGAGEDTENTGDSPEYDDDDENESEDVDENENENESENETEEEISIEELSEDQLDVEDDNKVETDARKQNQQEESDVSIEVKEVAEVEFEENDEVEVEVNEIKNELKLDTENIFASKALEYVLSAEKQENLQNSFLKDNKRLRVDSESSKDSNEGEKESPLQMKTKSSDKNEKTKEILIESNKEEAELTKRSSSIEKKENQPSSADDERLVIDIEQVDFSEGTETEKSPSREKHLESKNTIQLKEGISPSKELEKSNETIPPEKENELELKQQSEYDDANNKLENTTKESTACDINQVDKDNKINTAQQTVETPRTKPNVVEQAEDEQTTNNRNDDKQKGQQIMDNIAEVDMQTRQNKNDDSKIIVDTSKEDKQTNISSSVKPRGIRAGSVPVKITSFRGNITTTDESLTPKSRNTRSVSVDEEGPLQLTPRTRRSMRAKSMQPIPLKEEKELEEPEEPKTPIRMQRSSETRGTSVPPTTDATKYEQKTRGTSQPPPSAAAKITSRRRSTLLDAINESPNILDSPSTRTRSRLRLNSIDSELDTSLVTSEHPPQAKRTRKNSTSSNTSDQPTSIPTKHMRRSSFTGSHFETATPKTLRARSVLTVQEEEGKATTTKTHTKKRKKSFDESLNETIIKEESEEEEVADETENSKSLTAAIAEKNIKTSPPHESQPTTSSYSQSRRLTRTQLAMLEKSAALAGVSIHDLGGSSGTQVPSSPKRVTRRRTSRSTNASQHESDDAESVVSHRSNKSNATATRRITRSSVKDKDEVDDDMISVISSVGSEKPGKRRSNESKTSSSLQLPAIPEDETDEHSAEPKKPKTRRTKQ